MKMNTRKLILVVFFFFNIITSCYSQNIFYIKVKTSASSCDLCNNWNISSISYVYDYNYKPTVSITTDTYAWYEGPGSLRYWDPTADQYKTFTAHEKNTLYQEIHEYGHQSGNYLWHSVWFDAFIYTSFADSINSVNTSTEDGPIKCIKDINDTLSFYLTWKNPVMKVIMELYDTIYINAYSNVNGTYTKIGSVGVGDYDFTIKKVKFSDLNLQNYWEREIFFEVQLNDNGNRPQKGGCKTGSIIFIKPFPLPNVSVVNATCNGANDGMINFTYPSINSEAYVITLSKLVPKIGGLCVDNNGASSGSTNDEYPGYCLTGWTKNENIPRTNTSASITGVGAGTYALVIERSACMSCVMNGEKIIITEPSPLILESAAPQNTYSYNGNNYNIKGYGATDVISMSASGGTKPYKFSVDGMPVISTNSNPYNYANVLAGLRTIHLTDNNNCVATGNDKLVNMVQPDPITFSGIFPDTVWCNKLNEGIHNNGTLTFAINGGIGPFDIALNSSTNTVKAANPNDAYLTNLTADPYKVFVHDKYISSQNFSVIIPEHSRLGIRTIADSAKHWPPCVDGHNGYINLAGFGGLPDHHNYRFKIHDAKGINDTTNSATRLNNLEALVPYTIKITDKLNCSDSVMNVVIKQNPKPLTIVLLDTIRPLCNDYQNGTAHFTAINGDPFAPPLTPGFDFTLKNIHDTTSYKKLLRGDSVLFENIHQGVYEVKIKDINDCVINNYYRDTVPISQPDPLKIITSVRNASRKGLSNGSIQVVLGGGNKMFKYEYYRGLSADDGLLLQQAITTDTAVIHNLKVGDYLLRVQDTCGCSNGASSEGEANAWLEWHTRIDEPNKELSFVIKELKNTSCFGYSDGRLVLEGDGGWGNNYRYGLDSIHLSYDGLFNKLPAGLYTVYVVDALGEKFHDTVRINQPQLLTPQIDTLILPNCYGNANGSVRLSVTGGTMPFYVSTDNNLHKLEGVNVTNLSAGMYHIAVSDKNNCAASIDIPVGQPDSLSIRVDSLVHTLCGEATGKLVVTGSGGTPAYTYNWVSSDNTPIGSTSSVRNLPAGLYRLNLTDQHNCSKLSKWYNVSSSNGPVIADTVIKAVSCYGFSDGSIEIAIKNGTSPYNVFWSNGQTLPKAIGLLSGTYLVNISDSNRCKNFAELQVPTPDPLNIISLSVKNPQCYNYTNGSIAVSGKGGTMPYQYAWSNGFKNSNNLDLLSGIYSVHVTDANNCVADSSYTLSNPVPVIVNLGKEATICTGQTYSLDASAFALYNWTSDIGFVSTNRVVQITQQGTYHVEVTDSAGCLGHDSFTLSTSNSLLNADFIIKSEAMVGDTVIAIDVSWPVPDSTNWVYDRTNINGEGDIDYQSLIFRKAGSYPVTLYAALGNCRDNYSHTITIKEAGEETSELKSSVDESLIKEFKVSPNPNNGSFTVTVELRKESSILLRMFNNSLLLNQKSQRGTNIYSVQYSQPGLSPGIYLLQLMVGAERRQLKIVIY